MKNTGFAKMVFFWGGGGGEKRGITGNVEVAHCFGTQVWAPWRHVKTLYTSDDNFGIFLILHLPDKHIITYNKRVY